MRCVARRLSVRPSTRALSFAAPASTTEWRRGYCSFERLVLPGDQLTNVEENKELPTEEDIKAYNSYQDTLPPGFVAREYPAELWKKFSNVQLFPPSEKEKLPGPLVPIADTASLLAHALYQNGILYNCLDKMSEKLNELRTLAYSSEVIEQFLVIKGITNKEVQHKVFDEFFGEDSPDILKAFFAFAVVEEERVTNVLRAIDVFNTILRIHNKEMTVAIEFATVPTADRLNRLKYRIRKAFGEDADIEWEFHVKPELGKGFRITVDKEVAVDTTEYSLNTSIKEQYIGFMSNQRSRFATEYPEDEEAPSLDQQEKFFRESLKLKSKEEIAEKKEAFDKKLANMQMEQRLEFEREFVSWV